MNEKGDIIIASTSFFKILYGIILIDDGQSLISGITAVRNFISLKVIISNRKFPTEQPDWQLLPRIPLHVLSLQI